MKPTKLKVVLLTRREIIKLWQKQLPELLDYYCCPLCRGLLYNYSINTNENTQFSIENYYCHNFECKYYNVKREV